MSSILHPCLLIAVFACFARADDLPVVDPDLPQPFDESRTQELIAHSPFTRTVNLGDTLRLTGIAYVEGRPVATLLNKETKQSITVSDAPNEQGWRLTEASPSNDLEDSEITLQVGEEAVTMRFGDEQLNPGPTKKGVPTAHPATGSTRSGSRSDSRSGSDGGEHVKASSYLDAEGKAVYSALSSTSRSKFKEIVNARIEKHPDLTPEQVSAYAQKLVSSLQSAEARGTTGSVKIKKISKSSKLK